ncbi:hypothetical protein M0802_000522 [Mischocyttarus mexicanus]|nr:hypothetical protein M0802_000522 [Mischocyttarus mexicanus]
MTNGMTQWNRADEWWYSCRHRLKGETLLNGIQADKPQVVAVSMRSWIKPNPILRHMEIQETFPSRGDLYEEKIRMREGRARESILTIYEKDKKTSTGYHMQADTTRISNDYNKKDKHKNSNEVRVSLKSDANRENKGAELTSEGKRVKCSDARQKGYA